jgi:hypothetical protein
LASETKNRAPPAAAAIEAATGQGPATVASAVAAMAVQQAV